MTLDISAIRQRCSKGRFKEFEHETVLALCDEIERLRKYAQHLPDCQFQQAKVEFGANYFGTNILAESDRKGHNRHDANDVLDGYFRVPHDNPPRWLLVLYAYLDESGQEQKDWMCVAGFLGTEQQWRKLVPLWADAIKPRKHLHVSDLRFKKDRDRRLLERAGRIPEQCGLTGLVGAVRFSDYADLMSGPFEAKLYNAYLACCAGLVTNTLRGIPVNERLELIFERQDRYGWLLDSALDSMTRLLEPEMRMADGTPRLASWKFVAKRSTPLIEPADYFAYATAHAYREPNSLRTQWCMPILETGGGQGLGIRLRKDQIRRVVLRTQAMHLDAEVNRQIARMQDERQ